LNLSAYQRFVIGYHGCDAAIANATIRSGKCLTRSENEYDWLGDGIYFWEHGPDRALEWAKNKKERGEIKKPAVVGALIHLGNCFDLLDTRHTSILPEAFQQFQSSLEAEGKTLPVNSGGPDKLKRERDCALLRWLFKQFENQSQPFDSVRGVFAEGSAAFEGSAIQLKSHIQIAVRNPSCILGYFRPPST
jgi:hypothetical protein